MRFVREIGEKGQVVIPKDIRQLLSLKPKQKVVFEVQDREVKIKQEDSEEFLKDFLNVPKLKRRLTAKKIKKTILDQYEENIP